MPREPLRTRSMVRPRAAASRAIACAVSSAPTESALASRGTTRLANIRYRGGVTSYLEVLDSERELFDAELGLARSRRDELIAIVRIYKALGGGWQE